jgi:hypothetical protein
MQRWYGSFSSSSSCRCSSRRHTSTCCCNAALALKRRSPLLQIVQERLERGRIEILGSVPANLVLQVHAQIDKLPLEPQQPQPALLQRPQRPVCVAENTPKLRDAAFQAVPLRSSSSTATQQSGR